MEREELKQRSFLHKGLHFLPVEQVWQACEGSLSSRPSTDNSLGLGLIPGHPCLHIQKLVRTLEPFVMTISHDVVNPRAGENVSMLQYMRGWK